MDITQESTGAPEVLEDRPEDVAAPETDSASQSSGGDEASAESASTAFGDIDFGADEESDEEGGAGDLEIDSASTEVKEGISQSAAVGALTKQIEALKAQLDDRIGQYVRIAADFENFRKRTHKEREDLEFQAKCSTLSELLAVVDNFDRARMQIKPQTDQEMTIHKSYQSVYKQLVECLKRMGVSPMRAEGNEFDPNLHEAVMREPTNEYPEDTVIEELVRGYLLDDRVLRHAMVKVAGAPEPGAVSGEENASE